MTKKQSVQEQSITNHALLNVITPVGLEFTKNSLSVGENIGKIYGLIRYPQKVETEWLSKITNIPSTIVSIGFKPVDNATQINAISRSVVQQRGLAEGAKDPCPANELRRPPRTARKLCCRLTVKGKR